jgi:murein DD-endopeptidase MepM/ murein hydrolase activator NlpD
MILNISALRVVAAAIPALFSVLLIAACGGGGGNDPGVGAIITPGGGITIETAPSPTAIGTAFATPTTAAATPVSSPASGVASPTPTRAATTAPGDPNLRGFIWPIAGGCLPKGDQLMPNAPRTYRQGIHEGVDFYAVDNCVSVTRGTQVLAAKAGTVIRADLNYQDPTAQQMSLYLANPTTEASFDAFRGRQVWIRHDDGSFYVTRYCHLNGIAPGITVGTRVTAGQVIAYVGESGTPESITNPGSELHLHFEMRIGGSYLGAGQPAATVRQLYTTLFSP